MQIVELRGLDIHDHMHEASSHCAMKSIGEMNLLLLIFCMLSLAIG